MDTEKHDCCKDEQITEVYCIYSKAKRVRHITIGLFLAFKRSRSVR